MGAIELSENLQTAIDELKENLEKKPDAWFHDPKGIMFKPDFKRPEQARVNRDQNIHVTTLKSVFKSAYSKRLFHISGERLIYFKDKSSPVELGYIDLSQVKRIEDSILHDAPAYSIDLLTNDRCYTLGCQTSTDKLRWILALINVHELNKPERPRYQVITVTFPEKQLLYMNIRGVGYVEQTEDGEEDIHGEMLIIKSFQRTPEGNPGPAESSGRIKAGDQMIEVNGTNLESFTFDESVNHIKQSPWPLTIKLRRDRFASSLLPLTKDGWVRISALEGPAYTGYQTISSSSSPSSKSSQGAHLNGETYRRYVELRDSQLAFFQPTIGGSAMQKPEFSIELLNAIQFDLQSGQFESESIDYRIQIALNDDTTSTGNNSDATTRYIYMTFASENEMRPWVSAIAASYSQNKRRFETPLEMPKVIKYREVNSTNSDGITNLKSSLMVLIKDGPTSTSSGTFVPRFVEWFHNTIKIQRPKEKQWLGQTKYMIRQGSQCLLTSFEYTFLEDARDERAKYRVKLTFQDQTELTFASNLEKDLRQWRMTCESLEELEEIRVLRDSRLSFDSNGYQVLRKEDPAINTYEEENVFEHSIGPLIKDNVMAGQRYNDIIIPNEALSAIGMERSSTITKAFLMKKGEKKSTSLLGSEEMRRRYCLLVGAYLYYYKETIDCDAQGVIDLRFARDIRLSTNEMNQKKETEFAFEILTDSRIYSLAAENADSLFHWMTALSMAIDAFGGNIDEELHGAKKFIINGQDIVKEGFLKQYITKDNIIGQVSRSWKSKYTIITKDKIIAYENEADQFDPQIIPSVSLAATAVINLSTIVVDRNSNETGSSETNNEKYPLVDFDHLNAFEVNAGVDYSTGDDRVLVFCARDIYEAKEWMEAICHAGGDKFTIVENFKVVNEKEKAKEIVVYKSVPNEGASQVDLSSSSSSSNFSSTLSPRPQAHSSSSPAPGGPGGGPGRGRGRGPPLGRGKPGRGKGVVHGRGGTAPPVKPA